MTFYGRVDELEALTTTVETPNHEFFVVYGRRRVGKTGFLKELCQNRPQVYHLAAQEAESHQPEKFVEQVADHFDDCVPCIDDWTEAFDYPMEQS